MGSANSELEDIKTISHIFKGVIQEISNVVKSFINFSLIDEAVAKLGKLNHGFSDKEKKALHCIIEVSKKITIAVNDAKNVLNEANILCSTLNRVINSKASSNDEKTHLVILVFKESMDDFLPKLENARVCLSKITAELNTIVLQITNLKTWCLGKKKELENAKKSCITKERAASYSGAASATVAVVGIVAATSWWNPVGFVAVIISTGVAAASAAMASFSIAAGVTEGNIIPGLKKMYNDGIKEMEESVGNFQKMSKENEERSTILTEELNQLKKIASVARQAKDNGKNKFDVGDTMFNILKEDVVELNACVTLT